MESLNSGWEYIPEWSEAFARGEGTAETVRLPHTCGEVPLHYASPDRYARVCGYRRYLFVPGELRGKKKIILYIIPFPSTNPTRSSAAASDYRSLSPRRRTGQAYP